jgi:hypothetical protein
MLLDGFGEQRRTGIDGQIVEHALGGADRVRALAGDLARDLEGRGARVVADPRREAVAHGFLRREDAPGIGEIAQDIVAHEAGQDRRARHVGHQAPFDLHDRHPRIGREEAHVGAERELEAAAERHALDRGNHRHRKLPPAPHRLLAGKLARPWVRAERSRFSPPAIPLPPLSFIAAKRPISRPAQNARPSPDNTTARTPFSWASRRLRDQRLEHRAISSRAPRN